MCDSWIGIDVAADPPTERALSRSRRGITFVSMGPTHAGLELAKLARAVFTNGGCEHSRFAIQGTDETARYFFRRNMFLEYGFVAQLLTSDAFVDALPMLPPIDDDVDAQFEAFDTSNIAADLTKVLTQGGYNSGHSHGKLDIEAVGSNFATSILRAETVEFSGLRSFEGWSAWFGSVAWDYTWLLIDKRLQTVDLLCITDTDA